MLTSVWLDDGYPASSPYHPYASDTPPAAAAPTMSQYDRQSTHSSYDMMPDAVFPDQTFTRERSPQRNDNNMSSNQIGYGSAISFDENLYSAARVLAPAPVSNEDSTETASTNDTLPANGAVGQAPGGAMANPSTSAPYTSTPNNLSANTSNPDTLALTLANMELHHQGTYSQNLENWVGHAGAHRLVQHQAPLEGYSSSVASTRSAVSNGSWTHVVEPISMDEHLAFAGDWSNDALALVYGSSRPTGN